MPAIFSEQQKEKLREQLLITGFELLKQFGYRKMTIDDITKKCAIAKGTFYRFFKSKEDFVYESINIFMALTSFNSVTVFTIVSIILLSFSFPSNALSINSCEKSIYRISPFNSTLLILVLSGITFCNFSHRIY